MSDHALYHDSLVVSSPTYSQVLIKVVQLFTDLKPHLGDVLHQVTLLLNSVSAFTRTCCIGQPRIQALTRWRRERTWPGIIYTLFAHALVSHKKGKKFGYDHIHHHKLFIHHSTSYNITQEQISPVPYLFLHVYYCCLRYKCEPFNDPIHVVTLVYNQFYWRQYGKPYVYVCI